MENNNLEKIYAKIQKLLKLKEGAEQLGSMEEAANASARISELLLKYNIELSQIPGAKTESKVIIHRVVLDRKQGYNKTEGMWMISLFTVIAKHNLGKTVVVYKTPERIVMEILGEKHNCEAIEYFAIQMINVIKNLRIKSYKEREAQGYVKNKKAYYRAYCLAFVSQISIKLKAQDDINKEKYEGSTALIVVNDNAIAEKVEQEYGSLKSMKSKTLKSNIGKLDGIRDGKKTDLHQGLN